MNVFLESGLAGHRRGRFLATLLGAQPVSDPPAEGIVLMIGKSFQAAESAEQEAWWTWSTRPGRVLLLLPPFAQGKVITDLDWNVASCPEPQCVTGSTIADALAFEVNQTLTGADGESDPAQGHVWTDGALNTVLYKHHSASGMFAATCLPLWSIALLGKESDAGAWVKRLAAGAGQGGKPEDLREENEGSTINQLEPMDFSLLVCLYGWDAKNGADLYARLENSVVPLVRLDEKQIREGMQRLQDHGYFAGENLTAAGMAALMSSPYWPYAQTLKEQSA